MTGKQIDWTEEALEGCRWIESFPCPDCDGSRVSATITKEDRYGEPCPEPVECERCGRTEVALKAIRRALERQRVPDGYFIRIQHDPLDQPHRRWYVALFPEDDDRRHELISNASGETQNEAMTKALAAAPTPEDEDGLP